MVFWCAGGIIGGSVTQEDRMRQQGTKMIRIHRQAIMVGMAMMLFGLVGCTTETPKAAPPITQDQVREHSGQAFDKLKQEEKNRTTGSAVDHQ